MTDLPADSASSSAKSAGNEQPPDRAWAAFVVVAGVFAIVVIFGIAVARYKEASDVATATASVSGVIAALVGAYFGIRGATLAQTSTDQPAGTTGRTKAP